MDAAVGNRVLGEVQEVTLEEILSELRTTVQASTTGPTRYKLTHIPELDDIQARHHHSTKSSNLSISGRHLPLLYHLLSHLLSPPHNYTLLLIDIDGRFDPTRLTCSPPSLRHLYIQRPARSAVGASSERVRSVVADAEEFMLHGEGSAQSRGREWWGTVVVGAVVSGGGGGGGGGGLPAGDVAAGWKGWLKVEREAVGGFAMGMSLSEARERREERQKVVDNSGWAAESPWGGFVFDGG
ncbi:Peptidase M43, pregnancy-associated plasma-A [Sarocladium implicatum]|nr:Peptidase M43, pregnancy-associated plasma-A [Sarocladium implicatum]